MYLLNSSLIVTGWEPPSALAVAVVAPVGTCLGLFLPVLSICIVSGRSPSIQKSTRLSQLSLDKNKLTAKILEC